MMTASHKHHRWRTRYLHDIMHQFWKGKGPQCGDPGTPPQPNDQSSITNTRIHEPSGLLVWCTRARTNTLCSPPAGNVEPEPDHKEMITQPNWETKQVTWTWKYRHGLPWNTKARQGQRAILEKRRLKRHDNQMQRRIPDWMRDQRKRTANRGHIGYKWGEKQYDT